VLLLATIAFGVPLAVSLRDRVDAEVRSQARSQADVVAASATELLEPGQRSGLERLVRVSAESVRGRTIVVDGRGRLIADSAGAPPGRSYASRPEIQAALRGEGEQISRRSDTLGAEILATAVPVIDRGRTTGAVRITQSVAAVNHAVRTSILDLIALGGVVLALGLAAGALIARRIAQPIHRLDEAARRVAAGDLDTAVTVEGSSEQRSLGRAFNEMTQRIKRLLRSQQDFVADASHQLRTPLTGLRLRLENLADRFRGEAATATELDAAMAEIDRLSQIVEELLILSRAGEHELPGERVDLADVAARAEQRWREAARERGIGLEAPPADAPTPAWCAPADLDRAVDALVENALRYSPRGGTVTIAVKPGRVDVLDEGSGLEPGEERVVFERFHRGSAGRHEPSGTGLGLPIALELTRQWDGSVSLANRDGKGLRATIELPPAAVEAPA
jgi:two-component system, OmpR family, sensor kinase